MNAAIEIFEETGDSKYVHRLLNRARKTKSFGAQALEKVDQIPSNSKKLPRRILFLRWLKK